MSGRDETRAYGAQVTAIGIGLLAASVLLTIVMLRVLIGPFYFGAASDLPRSLATPLIWAPPAAPALQVAAEARAWEALVGEVLETGALPEPGTRTVIVVGGEFLERDDVAVLRRHTEAGGALALHGWLGASADLATRRRVFRSLVGSDALRELGPAAEATLCAGLRGALANGLAPTQPLGRAAGRSLPALAVDGELRWGRDAAARERRGAALRARVGAGRVVWLAVAPAELRSGDGRAAERVARNALRWLAAAPLVEIAPWPRVHSFAVLRSGALEQVQYGGALASLGRPWPGTPPGYDGAAGLYRIGAAHDDALVRELAGRGAWLADARDLARWWELRRRIEVEVRRTGPRRLDLDVTNAADVAARGVVVRIHLGGRARTVETAGAVLFQRTGETRLLPGGETIELSLPELARRDSVGYEIELTWADAAGPPGPERELN